MNTTNTTNTTKPKTRTITLTGKPPVKIREDQWPVVAQGGYEDCDNQFDFQSSRITDLDIRVRRHDDGRSVVYGVYDYTTRWQGERSETKRAGYVIDPDGDIVATIKRVGDDLVQQAVRRDIVRDIVRDAVNECIADLPAQEI